MGYIPPSITDDIIEMVEHYGMIVSNGSWSSESGEFKLTLESNNPMNWDSVVDMIEYEFNVKALIARFDYADDYMVTLAIYP